MVTMLINLLILSVAVFLVARFLPGIQVKNVGTVVWVAVVYSLVSFFFGGFLRFLSFPFIFITFGLFKLLINAVLLWITDKILKDFQIKDFLTTLIAAVCITAVDWAVRWVMGMEAVKGAV